MWTYSIKWVFLCKSSPCTKHNWQCTIGFLINTARQNIFFHPTLPFIFSSRIFFFFFVSNIYISLNTKFECFYLSFDWETGHPLSMYAIREWRGSSKMYTGAYKGRGVSHPCLMVSCFICRNLTLPSFKRDVSVGND